MSILESRLKNEKEKKELISNNIAGKHINPNEQEQVHANEILQIISRRFSNELVNGNVDDYREEITKAVEEECDKLNATFAEKEIVKKTVLMTALGNGPIEKYLEDDAVTEVVVQRYDKIVYEKAGKIEKAEEAFTSEEHLQTIIKRIVQQVGRQISISNPIVDARLRDGSRVNATIPPVSVDGATLTIRKFSDHFLTGQDYVNKGSLSPNMLIFLNMCVLGKLSMIVSGGTGTGKTTMLNMLSSFIPKEELIITIEDSCELKLQQPNVRRMETRLASNEDMLNVDQKALVKAALRQRPDRIILGETRDGSIVDIISAMSTGHEGSMTTIHANSPQNLCNVRIPMLYAMNRDVDFSEKSISMQVSEAVQLIIYISRFPDGSRKVTHISEITGYTDEGKVIIKNIFVYDRKEETFKWTGYTPKKIIQTVNEKGYVFPIDILK